MKVYFPQVLFPMPSEGAPICDYVLQGFLREQDAKDLYPEAEIEVIEFPDVNPMSN